MLWKQGRKSVFFYYYYYIESLHATLNSCIPSRTIQEWEIENKEQIINRHKAYYVNNKEHTNTITKEYYQNNKEHLTILRKTQYLENSENLLNKHKEYYIEHKTKMLEYQNTKCECPCGSSFSIYNKSAHLKNLKTFGLPTDINLNNN